jgi:hypothetical protein
MIRRVLIFSLLALFAAATQVQAQSLTTLYAANNSGSFGGAVYFDVQVAGNNLDITGFDINTNEAGVAFNNFQVWILPGLTSVGNQSNGSPWVQVATGSGTGAGLNQPTAVTLSNSFTLDANTLYGMALVAGSNIGHDYTNGTGTNQFFSNSDLSLTLGSATNVPFSGSAFSPRVFNGTVYYQISAIPEPSTVILLGGMIGLIAGCHRRRR